MASDTHPPLGGSERYVKTTSIKEAVQGHETDVFRALNIAWPARGHITCPYPDHGGEADWRWDEKKKAAFCSCIGTRPGERKRHSILDVVTATLGIDLEAAKIRTAEIIGRPDLIITKRPGSGGNKTDWASLLAPPASNRDDGLVWIYLCHRLGIDPETVPRPSTHIAGHRALVYFEPLANKNQKPRLVTSAPCAVFEQVDFEGRRHAHRIYLAPDGRGKADLGTGFDGKPRDPKKSAKVVDGQSTAGRSVLWGNPETATRTFASEGIETAAAVALGFREEIDAGDFLVVAAISAAGLEAFRPWPSSKELVVAADRDEGTTADGRTRDRRGERAARTLCARHHKIIRCCIALPGISNEKVNWLDILRRDGITAVRDGVLAGVEYHPTDDELALEQQREDQGRKIERISKQYPLPFLEGIQLCYQATRDGQVWIYKSAGRDEGRETWVRKCSPIGVPAKLRLADADDAYGLRIQVEDMDGRPRALDFDRADLARMNATEIRARLFAAGLRVEGDGEQIAIHILKAAAPTDVITIVSRPGWHRLPDPVFVTPAGEVFGASELVKIELAATARLAPRIGKAGTLSGWQVATAAAIEASNCPHWTLGIIAGFAGPILALTGLDTCGINLSGDTSVGKTTAQQLAVSAWSSPAITDNGLLCSMRSTENAVEVLAQGSHGTVLALDELAHADGKAVGRTIYSLAGNVGKSRMRADATLKPSYTWLTFAILSAECTLEEKIKADGGQWTGGMAVRFADIDVAGCNRAVEKERLNTLRTILMHYGQAGPEFVRQLMRCKLHRDSAVLKEKVLKAARTLAGTGADGAKIRAAIPFAVLLVSGELARQFGILPQTTSVRTAIGWAWESYTSSSGALALMPEEQAMEALRAYIARGWDVTIKDVDDRKRINNREACGWYNDETIYLPVACFREVTSSIVKERRLAKLLEERKLLSECGTDRIPVRYIKDIGHVTSYALKREDFGRERFDYGYRARA